MCALCLHESSCYLKQSHLANDFDSITKPAGNMESAEGHPESVSEQHAHDTACVERPRTGRAGAHKGQKHARVTTCYCCTATVALRGAYSNSMDFPLVVIRYLHSLDLLRQRHAIRQTTFYQTIPSI